MFNSLIDYLRSNGIYEQPKIVGKELKYPCPICRQSGGDTKGDNLCFNSSKGAQGLIYCFANSDHSKEILKQIRAMEKGSQPDKKSNIAKNKGNNKKKQQQPEKEITLDRSKEFLVYQGNCTEELLNNEKAKLFLLKKRGINEDTIVNCGIGIDTKKRRWVFPVYDMNDNLVGFEYRPPYLEKKGLYKEQGTPNCLCQINNKTDETEVLLIIEGFLDGYVFYQHLKDNGQDRYYHVITPSCGVTKLLDLLKEYKGYYQYRKIYVYIDNDQTSLPIMDTIDREFPFMETVRMNCGCKDFNEHYLNCLIPRKLKIS